jgi:hypothetical protein
MLPPTCTYRENKIERSISVFSPNSFTRMMYQRVLPKLRYMVRNTKTRETMLLLVGLLAMIEHWGGVASIYSPD